MSEGQSQRSVTSSAQHQQEAEVTTSEERERAAAETAATAARAARLVMAELVAARVEMEAAAAVDAARVAAVELEALRTSSTGISVSADNDRDNELKLRNPRGTVAAALTGADVPAALWAGARAASLPLTVAIAQTGTNAPAAGLTEIVAFTGGAALPPGTGTMVTMGSRPLSGTSVSTAGGLPSPRPTTSSEPR
jgi:hypothetical protein